MIDVLLPAAKRVPLGVMARLYTLPGGLAGLASLPGPCRQAQSHSTSHQPQHAVCMPCACC